MTYLDSSDAIQLIIIAMLVLLSAFFSSAETALTTVNKLRIKTLADQGDKRAVTLLKVTEDPGKMLSAILIGNNIVNISASSLTTTWVTGLFGNAAVGVSTGVLTLVILIFGEITPKTMATVHAEKLGLAYSGIIYFLVRIMTPLIFIVNKLANGVLKLLRIESSQSSNAITEHELRTIVDVSHEEGVIESDERQMIYNVFDFSDAHAKDIMIPRINMVTVSLDATYDDVLAVFRDSMYTRLPVYEDDKDNIIGLINIKDFILTEDQSAFHVGNILRDAYYTYEAPGHKECKLCRLHDPQDIDGGRLINGLSHFLPSGGGTEFGDNAMESIYYIVEGTMLFKGDDGVETVLEAGDSVHIAPHSKKCVTNIGTTTAQMLVVLLPEAAK